MAYKHNIFQHLSVDECKDDDHSNKDKELRMAKKKIKWDCNYIFQMPTIRSYFVYIFNDNNVFINVIFIILWVYLLR